MGVCGWAASHSERNFYDADSYHPERWLGDPRFVNDNKKAAQAFSYGPRNCIGKKLVIQHIITLVMLTTLIS